MTRYYTEFELYPIDHLQAVSNCQIQGQSQTLTDTIGQEANSKPRALV